MKKILLLLIFATNIMVGQSAKKEQLVTKLSDYTCACFSKKDITSENLNSSLGVCIIEAVGINQKDVDAIYGKNVITNASKMDLLSQDMAVKLTLDCPKFLEKITAMSNEKEAENFDEDLLISGKVKSITTTNYLTLNLVEFSGKSHELILLTNFENSFLLTDKVIKDGDAIDVYYYELDVFDIKLNKFITQKILTDIIKK